MIQKWFSEQDKKGYSHPFVIKNIFENDTTEIKDELIEYLGNTLLIHLVDIFSWKESYSNEDKSLFHEDLENYVLCTDQDQLGLNTRQGDWAEVISAEILEKNRGFILPIYKLRWKETKDKSMRGKADVVVCDIKKINGGISNFSIVFTEVKSKIRYTSPSEVKRISKNACEHLSCVEDTEKPEIVNFIWDKLRFTNQGEIDYDLLTLFDKARIHPGIYSKDYQVFFVVEEEHWRDEFLEIIDIAKSFELPNLTVNIVLIDSMENLIHDTYAMIPKVAEELVYG